MSKRTLGILLAIVMAMLLAYSGVAAAAKKSSKDKNEVAQKEMSDAEVMDMFKKLFPNFSGTDIRKAPITGLYEIEGGGNIIYFDPTATLIIFGEVLDKNGKNMTAERRNEISAKMLAQIPIDKGIKIGNGPKTVVLFTDPDCPYCRKVSDYFKTKAADITQYIFFFPLIQIHPNSEAKAKYVLSQNDPGKAYYEVMAGEFDKADVKTIKFNDTSAAKLAEHMTYANRVGVRGTPVMWVNGRYVPGANMPLIESLLK